MVKKSVVAALAATLAGALSVSACSQQGSSSGSDNGKETVTFAVVGPLTGDSAAYGTNEWEGASLAAKEINAAGGIDGKTVVLKKFDDKCDPTEAANAASRIASDSSIIAVIGHVCSAATQAALPVYQRAGLTVLSGSSTNPDLSKHGYKNFFRTIPTDDAQGAQMVDFAVNQLGKKKIGVIYSSDDYGQGLLAAGKDEATKQGATIVDSETFTPSSTKDFTAQLTKLAGAKPDALLMFGYYGDMGTMVSQLSRTSLGGVTLIGSAGVSQPDYIKLGGSATEGTSLIAYYDPQSPLAANKKFVEAFKQTYKDEPNEQAAYAYEIPFVYKEAIEKENADKKSMSDALHKISYEGPTGTTKFASDGDVVGKTGVVVTVKNQKLVLDETLTKKFAR